MLAAEWGHGRRRGWLSNLHLGAIEPATGELIMLGKTFKGMTDAMLAWQTEELLKREVSRDEWTVRVRPELVVEVMFNDLQASPRYSGGLALRFARIKRYRPDKDATEADTMDVVRRIYAGPKSVGFMPSRTISAGIGAPLQQSAKGPPERALRECSLHPEAGQAGTKQVKVLDTRSGWARWP